MANNLNEAQIDAIKNPRIEWSDKYHKDGSSSGEFFFNLAPFSLQPKEHGIGIHATYCDDGRKVIVQGHKGSVGVLCGLEDCLSELLSNLEEVYEISFCPLDKCLQRIKVSTERRMGTDLVEFT
ncbi:hypothetical protein V2H45_11405 [Tumidithrix elongata RA019]|uniref:Uncharacterized protein n=1 Tax=Tumidithrix elongata BACA0141 TaxID=2716417 RepID=A0AAW9PTG4_9CYAN|nr:hypothetical protein [Tumidithrix elongata RA019]